MNGKHYICLDLKSWKNQKLWDFWFWIDFSLTLILIVSAKCTISVLDIRNCRFIGFWATFTRWYIGIAAFSKRKSSHPNHFFVFCRMHLPCLINKSLLNACHACEKRVLSLFPTTDGTFLAWFNRFRRQ